MGVEPTAWFLHESGWPYEVKLQWLTARGDQGSCEEHVGAENEPSFSVTTRVLAEIIVLPHSLWNDLPPVTGPPSLIRCQGLASTRHLPLNKIRELITLRASEAIKRSARMRHPGHTLVNSSRFDRLRMRGRISLSLHCSPAVPIPFAIRLSTAKNRRSLRIEDRALEATPFVEPKQERDLEDTQTVGRATPKVDGRGLGKVVRRTRNLADPKPEVNDLREHLVVKNEIVGVREKRKSLENSSGESPVSRVIFR